MVQDCEVRIPDLAAGPRKSQVDPGHKGASGLSLADRLKQDAPKSKAADSMLIAFNQSDGAWDCWFDWMIDVHADETSREHLERFEELLADLKKFLQQRRATRNLRLYIERDAFLVVCSKQTQMPVQGYGLRKVLCLRNRHRLAPFLDDVGRHLRALMGDLSYAQVEQDLIMQAVPASKAVRLNHSAETAVPGTDFNLALALTFRQAPATTTNTSNTTHHKELSGPIPVTNLMSDPWIKGKNSTSGAKVSLSSAVSTAWRNNFTALVRSGWSAGLSDEQLRRWQQKHATETRCLQALFLRNNKVSTMVHVKRRPLHLFLAFDTTVHTIEFCIHTSPEAVKDILRDDDTPTQLLWWHNDRLKCRTVHPHIPCVD